LSHDAVVLRPSFAPDATTAVLAAYVALAATPFVAARSHRWFWEGSHRTAPVATGVFIALLVALVFRRRWAWILLVLFEVAVAVSFAVDFVRGDLAWIWFALNLASLALLLSAPMRRYVRRDSLG
jgi:hypothetical protein